MSQIEQEKVENLDPLTAYTVDQMTGERTPIEGAAQPEGDDEGANGSDGEDKPKRARRARKAPADKPEGDDAKPEDPKPVDDWSDEEVADFLKGKGLEPDASDSPEALRSLAKDIVDSESEKS